jgi:hypothetical protein
VPTKIELIADGNGGVIVFVNGRPESQFFCEYDIPRELLELLQKVLTKYGQ